jgi:hypothetical protein
MHPTVQIDAIADRHFVKGESPMHQRQRRASIAAVDWVDSQFSSLKHSGPALSMRHTSSQKILGGLKCRTSHHVIAFPSIRTDAASIEVQR